MTKKLSLLEQAKAAQGSPGTKPSIDMLIDEVSDSERAEILELLRTSKHEVQHAAVARVLNNAFGDRLARPATQQQVANWRQRNGVA